MQIGNHVYCDTALILKELERRYPTSSNSMDTAQPSGHQANNVGLSEMVATWVDVSAFLFASLRA